MTGTAPSTTFLTWLTTPANEDEVYADYLTCKEFAIRPSDFYFPDLPSSHDKRRIDKTVLLVGRRTERKHQDNAATTDLDAPAQDPLISVKGLPAGVVARSKHGHK